MLYAVTGNLNDEITSIISEATGDDAVRYALLDTRHDVSPTCDGGDIVRVQRTIDFATCWASSGDVCLECEVC